MRIAITVTTGVYSWTPSSLGRINQVSLPGNKLLLRQK